MKNPEIHYILDVSTAHVCEADTVLLNTTPTRDGTNVVLDILEYGYLIYVPGEDLSVEDWDNLLDEGYSTDFINLFVEAQNHGCTHIRLDPDGRIYEDLPEFIW
jgi:hypothetical protein